MQLKQFFERPVDLSCTDRLSQFARDRPPRVAADSVNGVPVSSHCDDVIENCRHLSSLIAARWHVIVLPTSIVDDCDDASEQKSVNFRE